MTVPVASGVLVETERGNVYATTGTPTYPTNPSIGDLFYDYSGAKNRTVQMWTGAAWVPYVPELYGARKYEGRIVNDSTAGATIYNAGIASIFSIAASRGLEIAFSMYLPSVATVTSGVATISVGLNINEVQVNVPQTFNAPPTGNVCAAKIQGQASMDLEISGLIYIPRRDGNWIMQAENNTAVGTNTTGTHGFSVWTACAVAADITTNEANGVGQGWQGFNNCTVIGANNSVPSVTITQMAMPVIITLSGGATVGAWQLVAEVYSVFEG